MSTEEYLFPINEILDLVQRLKEQPITRVIEKAQKLTIVEASEHSDARRHTLLALDLYLNNCLAVAPYFRSWKSRLPFKSTDSLEIRYSRDRQVIDFHWFASRMLNENPACTIPIAGFRTPLVNNGEFDFAAAQSLATRTWRAEIKAEKSLRIPLAIQVECATVQSEYVRKLKQRIDNQIPKVEQHLFDLRQRSSSKLSMERANELLNHFRLLRLANDEPRRAAALEKFSSGDMTVSIEKRARAMSESKRRLKEALKK